MHAASVQVSNVTIRGVLALVLTLGLIVAYIIYQQVPTELVVLTSTAIGYFFGHSGAESASISQRQNGSAMTPDVITGGQPKATA